MEKRRSSIQEVALADALKASSSAELGGELFDRTQEKDTTHHLFPTLPAFLVSVEVKDAPHYGAGHKGVFALENISKNTKFWVWTDRIRKGIPGDELRDYIHKTFGNYREAIQIFLRQGFVLPHADIFYTNPTDAGRYFNH